MDEIRVMWSEYKGHRYLDIRVYTEIDGKADKVPTKNGVTLRPDLIPELMEGTGKRVARRHIVPRRRRTHMTTDTPGLPETEDLGEYFEECAAAILEHDAGVPRPEAGLETARGTATLARNRGYLWASL